MKRWADAECYIDHFLKTETLKSDFLAVMRQHDLAAIADLERIENDDARPNASRKAPIRREDFYDDETRALVAERDAYIIDRFKYTF